MNRSINLKPKLALFALMLLGSFLGIGQVELVDNLGHSEIVTSLELDEGGDFLVSAGFDGRVIIWDYRSKKEYSSYTHGGQIYDIHITKENLLISGGLDAMLYFYDLKEGKLVHSVKAAGPVYSLAVNIEENWLAYGSENGRIYIISLSDYKEHSQLKDQVGLVTNLAFKDHYLLSGSYTGMLQVHDGHSGEMLGLDLLSHEITSIKVNTTNNQFLITDGTLKIFNLNIDQPDPLERSWNIELEDAVFVKGGFLGDTTIIGVINQFSREEVIGGYVLFENKSEQISDKPLDSLIMEKYFFPSSAGIFSYETSQDGNDLILGLKNGALAEFKGINEPLDKVIEPFSNSNLSWVLNMSFSPNGRYLSFFSSALNILDMKDFSIQIESAGDVLIGASFVNDSLLAVRRPNKLELFYPANKESKTLAVFEKEVFQASPFALWCLPFDNNKIVTNIFNPDSMDISMVSLESGNIQNYYSYPLGVLVTSMKLDREGQKLLSASSQGEIVLFDVKNEEILFRDKTKEAVILSSTAFAPDGQTFAFSRSGEKVAYIEVYHTTSLERYKIIDVTTGLKNTHSILHMTYSNDAETLICFLLNGEAIEVDLNTETVVNRFRAHHTYIFSQADHPGKKFFVTGGGDNTIQFWDFETKANILEITKPSYLNRGGNFTNRILKTPVGYYSAIGVEDLQSSFSFKIEKRLFGFEQLDLKYNRPDKVFESLLPYLSDSPFSNSSRTQQINAYYQAYQKRLEKLRFSEEMLSSEFNVPKLEIDSKNLPTLSRSSHITFSVEATDSKEHLDRIQVLVNGVPAFGKNGIDLRPLKTKTHRQEIELPLSLGKNRIQVSVLNQGGGQSLKETIYITRQGGENKRDLYLIAAGVSNYEIEDLNLKYPDKDVADIKQLFESNTDYFNQIHVEELLDEKFTWENLAQIKESLLKKSTVDDVVIIYYSGHGMVDEDLDYYLATSSTDFLALKGTAVTYEAVEGLLDAIPSRNKLLLIDACHSGEIDKSSMELTEDRTIEEGAIKFRSFGNIPGYAPSSNSFGLMKQLFSDLSIGNGATVISSAGAAEFAVEGETWGNGVFTYCLLKGLGEKKADLDQNGRIMVLELQRYLEQKVSELTSNLQKPNFRRQNINNDWRVW